MILEDVKHATSVTDECGEVVLEMLRQFLLFKDVASVLKLCGLSLAVFMCVISFLKQSISLAYLLLLRPYVRPYIYNIF